MTIEELKYLKKHSSFRILEIEEPFEFVLALFRRKTGIISGIYDYFIYSFVDINQKKKKYIIYRISKDGSLSGLGSIEDETIFHNRYKDAKLKLALHIFQGE